MKQSSLFSFFQDSTPKSKHTTPSKEPSVSSTPIKRPTSSPLRTPTKPKVDNWNWLVHPKDANQVAKGEPNYDPTTLYIPTRDFQKLTNMEKQFWSIKKTMFDTILFFQKGKFYEIYACDADIAHQEFNMTLANRTANMRMCGVPLPSFNTWAHRFATQGYKVAKVDQGEDDGKMKSRSLTRVYTKGTLFELDHSPFPSFICAIDGDQMVLLDTSTASLYPLPTSDLHRWLSKGEIKQVVLKDNSYTKLIKGIDPLIDITIDPLVFMEDYISVPAPLQSCTNALMHVLKQCLLYDQLKDHVQIVDHLEESSFPLHANTIEHLDLFPTIFQFLDKTTTSMGKRLLKQWLCHPLKDVHHIIMRQQAILEVTTLPFQVAHFPVDVPKVLTRMAANSTTPKQVLCLLHALDELTWPEAKCALLQMQLPTLSLPIQECEAMVHGEYMNEDIQTIVNDMEDLNRLAEEHLGPGQSYVAMHGEQFVIETQSSLNKTLHSKSAKVYRYTDAKTKQYSEAWQGLVLKKEACIQAAFDRLQQEILAQKSAILKWSDAIALVDVLHSCAVVNGSMPLHCTPQFEPESGHIYMDTLSHPLFPEFVPNTVKLAKQQLLLTGTNMGGKSTLLRQVCLAVLMAQMGLDVACTHYACSVFDQIMTRVGASDDMHRGQSTFQVELLDVLEMIKHGTENSLLILDEFGRGTSSADGEALAMAVMEYFQERGNVVLFATHYKLDIDVEKYYLDYSVEEGEMVFLYQLKRGVCPSSCGIHVARMAQLPVEVVCEAENILSKL